MLLTVLAFIVALGVLVIIHEYGHYRMAVACGVKVLRFSVGFGKPFAVIKRGPDQTEFAIAPLPLGGYVRMLDEREAPVAPEELHRAVNRQPLRSRALIVAAGPVANLLLAIVLFIVVGWIGVDEPRAILSAPAADSIAARAGIESGDRVDDLTPEGGETVPVLSMSDLQLQLVDAAIAGEDVILGVTPQAGSSHVQRRLSLSQVGPSEVDGNLLSRVGLAGVWTSPTIGRIEQGSAAASAGLQQGDLVKTIDRQPVRDALELRRLIQANSAGRDSQWQIERGGRALTVTVRPAVVTEGDRSVGRIGAYVGAAPELVRVSHGLFGSIPYGMQRTWDLSWLTLRMLGKMVIGQASLSNLSGPITIADAAGQSARLGPAQYISFLALVSLSLGVLNLLPLPVLDGGHLLYYLLEAVRGKPLSDQWTLRLQKGGVAVLLLLMGIALFNDIARLVGPW